MPRTILITGATGQVSRTVLEALEETDRRVRVLVRDPDRAQAFGSEVEVHEGDLGDPGSLGPAFAGVDDLWLLVPNGPRAPEHSMNAIWAARQAGVERVVRLSVIGAGHDAPTRSGRLHALSDEELRRSEMSWTIVRPHWFMQNLLGAADHVATTGELRLSMGEGRLGMIDVRDIGALAAHVLTSEPDRYHGESLTLTGPEAISFVEVAEELSRATGRSISYVPISDEEAYGGMVSAGAPAWIAAMVLEHARAHASGWGDFTTSDFERALGRPPRTIGDFARDHAVAFGADGAAVEPAPSAQTEPNAS